MSNSAHSPNRYLPYFETHATIMKQFRDGGFVGSDNILVKKYGPKPEHNSPLGGFVLWGEIYCKGNIIIGVGKLLRIVDPNPAKNPTIQTVIYRYHVSVLNRFSVFRYDNQHIQKGHPDAHHKHKFLPSGEELPDSPFWTGEDNWPTLGAVIAEAKKWYWNYHDALSLGDEYPPERSVGCDLLPDV